MNIIHGFGQMMRVFFGIIMTAMGLGEAASFAPDANKLEAAIISVFALLNRKSLIDPEDESGEKPAQTTGLIELKDVDFHYPSRPTIPIMSKFSLTIAPGQMTALVGESGGGKSTVFQLLQRFYDPISGTVSLDGTPVQNINIAWLRQ